MKGETVEPGITCQETIVEKQAEQLERLHEQRNLRAISSDRTRPMHLDARTYAHRCDRDREAASWPFNMSRSGDRHGFGFNLSGVESKARGEACRRVGMNKR